MTDTVTVHVSALDGKTYDILVDSKTTLKDFKELLVDATGTPILEQRLIFQGIELEDGLLVQQGVAAASEIQLVKVARQTWDGRRVKLCCGATGRWLGCTAEDACDEPGCWVQAAFNEAGAMEVVCHAVGETKGPNGELLPEYELECLQTGGFLGWDLAGGGYPYCRADSSGATFAFVPLDSADPANADNASNQLYGILTMNSPMPNDYPVYLNFPSEDGHYQNCALTYPTDEQLPMHPFALVFCAI